MRKKAIVGDTMTWFLAFLVIFFLIFLFDVIALNIAKTRSQFAISGSQITLEDNSQSASTTLELISVLNSPLTLGDKTLPFYSWLSKTLESSQQEALLKVISGMLKDPCKNYKLSLPFGDYINTGAGFNSGILIKNKNSNLGEAYIYSKPVIKISLMENKKC